MKLVRKDFEILIFGADRLRRYTQDTPVRPDVWLAFSESPSEPVPLLLSPLKGEAAPRLAQDLRSRLAAPRNPKKPSKLAYNQTVVAADLTFEEMMRAAMPLSDWWRREVKPIVGASVSGTLDELAETAGGDLLTGLLQGDEAALRDLQVTPGLALMVRIAGSLALAPELDETATSDREGLWREVWSSRAGEIVRRLARLYRELAPAPEKPSLWTINRNRPASSSVSRSSMAVKADAARRLFRIGCRDLRWAVLDSGIDATHPAFRRRDPKTDELEADRFATRVDKTFDFSVVRDLLSAEQFGQPLVPDSSLAHLHRVFALKPETLLDLRDKLLSGRDIDWSLVAEYLEVSHREGRYVIPEDRHGTHVAGILGGDVRPHELPKADLSEDLVGVCPDIGLYDLRVLNARGEGDEFSVMSALQFIRYLNSRADRPVIQGANLSLAIPHDVTNYACGRTPVCEECDRLVHSGVAVVTAAGNQGYKTFTTQEGGSYEGYLDISITDPGNADSVITVGSTHRYRPHTYGVSYFSSRGPTGDGRAKPDLVAPGERIEGPVPGGEVMTMDGTSMAAPHVSGACALLMARHAELIGDPARLKQVLKATATDLGRDRYFQGAGMLDVLRALQSI